MNQRQSNRNLEVRYHAVGGWLVLLCLFMTSVNVNALLAQSVEDIIYPYSVPLYSDKSFPRLSKNDIEEVKAFYQTAIKMIQGDRELVETSTKGGEGPGSVSYSFGFRSMVQGIMVGYADGISIWSVDKDLYLKEAGKVGSQRIISLPWKHLQDIAKFRQAGYTEEDYNRLASQYQNLSYAFFREIEVAPGETKSEDEVIYEKHYRQVYGTPVMPARKPGEYDTEKRKRIEETARKIKELRDQGKTREAMELSAKLQQEIKQDLSEAGGPDLMKIQRRAMSKEAWGIWIQCLKELDSAAYRTRIEYAGPLTMYE